MRRIFSLVCILALLAAHAFAQSTPPGTPIPSTCPSTGACTWNATQWNSFFSWLGNKTDNSTLAANAVAYGADPTGVADSTTAINGAIATGRGVYLPAGTYLVTGALSDSYSACIYGDGPHATLVHVTSAFSASASGVFVLANTNHSGGAVGPCIHDLQVEFDQPTTQTVRANFAALGTCTTASGGTGCKYPPAIYDTNAGDRVWIHDVTVAGAWTGIYFGATGDVHNVAFWLDNIEMGALSVGLSADGAEDWTHVKGFHFWPFGIGGTTESTVFRDGTTQCANLGRQDGLEMLDFVAIDSTFVITADASGSEDGWRIDNIDLSSGPAVGLLVQGGYNTSIVNLHTNATAANGSVMIEGGNTTITASFFPVFSGPTFGDIYQTSGNLTIDGSSFYQNSSVTSVYKTGGALYFQGNLFADGGSVSVPLIVSTGGSIVAVGNTAAYTSTGGVAIDVTNDVVNNMVRNNNFGHDFTYEFPCTNCATAAGVYQTEVPGAGVMVSTSWSTGPVTSFPMYPAGLFTVTSASSIDRVVLNMVGLNGGGTVNVVLLNCGIDPSCGTSPTTLVSYTVAADGAVTVPITVNQVPAGSYVAWEITGGTWSSANLTFLTAYHVN